MLFFVAIVPRTFITVFRLFTKDEWFEIKTEMYSLQIKPFIIDLYVLSWLFFGGYVLNPLLIGAMVILFILFSTELRHCNPMVNRCRK